MKRFFIFVFIFFIGCCLINCDQTSSESSRTMIRLPKPHREGGMSLMKALNMRSTGRDFSNRPLSADALSDLLWAAFGINRMDSGKRTAPSSHQLREIEIYVMTEKNCYRYIPEQHALKRTGENSMSKAHAEQHYVRNAPVSLIYVADFSKYPPRLDDPKRESLKKQISSTHCGFIGQNVYLFCASRGLNCVFHGWMNAGKIHKMLGLESSKHVLFGQAVGYKKNQGE